MADGPLNPSLLGAGPVLPPNAGQVGGGLAERGILEFLGFHAVPGRLLPRPGPLVVTWALPQPLGVTPPRYVGLEDAWFLGYTPSEVVTGVTGRPIDQRVADANRAREQARLAAIGEQAAQEQQLAALTTAQLVSRLSGLNQFGLLVEDDPTRLGILFALSARPVADVQAAFAQLEQPRPAARLPSGFVALDSTVAVVQGLGLASILNSTFPPDP